MRKKQVILLLCALMLLAACRPKGILSSRQMRNVLYDLHRADAIIQVKGYSYNHDEEIAKYYQVVLDKHHVTKAEFDSSLVWYTDHPQLFNRIYPKIMKRCQRENEYWKELENQEHPEMVQVRELPPIEEVMQTLQYGYEISLLPDSILSQPQDEEELLLPIGHCDSVSVASSTSKPSEETQVNESASSVDESEEIIDGMTPEERRRQQQIERLHKRLGIKPATAK